MTPDLVVVAGSYAPADAPGIRAFGLDLEGPAFVELGSWSGVVNPSFLAIAPDGRRLYAVSEVGADAGGGRVRSFAVTWRHGHPELVPGRTVATDGDQPCHLGLDPAGQWLAVANYGSGSVAIIGLEPPGELGTIWSSVHHDGSGPDPSRQTRPHAHSAMPTVDGRHVVVADLGADRVTAYAVDGTTGALTHLCDGPVAPGAGPRHTAIHPDGRLIVVANELDNTVTTYVLDTRSASLERRDTVSTLPSDAPSNLVAEVHLAPDGRRVYVSNRGHDSIATFELAADGGLVRTGVDPCGGSWPRNFAVLPDGSRLVVANERSDELVLLPTTDHGVGAPVARVSMPSPTCVLVTSIPS